MAQFLSTPITWEMSSAQIISPTNSALSTINGLQACVTASTSWSVVSTGTVTGTGAKYVEIKTSDVNSIYKDYRIVFYEKVVSSTNKSTSATMTGTITWNSTSFAYVHFNPFGGTGTFNPNNCEGAVGSHIYSGGSTGQGRYQSGGSYYDVWGTIPLPCTALWTYLGNGAFWFVNRAAATSHTLMGIGAIVAQNTVGLFGVSGFINATGQAVMQPVSYYKAGISSASLTPSVLATSTTQRRWTTSAIDTSQFVANAGPGSIITPTVANNIGVFIPITLFGPGTVMRGLYTYTNAKTRATFQDAGVTVGYNFYPDDSQATTSLATLAFMNS